MTPWIADLHIHSKYAMATSKESDLKHIDAWARNKGIRLAGTGDFTHPKWRQEMRELLEPAGEGVYRLKKTETISCSARNQQEALFLITGEISTIYKQDGKTRKVHHLFLLPGLEAADRLAEALEDRAFDLAADGRPILKMDSRSLLELTLDVCPETVCVPAHIWTPHFSLFGAYSDFDSAEECYGDLAEYIHALETGLSSDPAMNRKITMLDKYQLISNSDAHSPMKLGREATLFSCEMSFSAVKRALETGEGLEDTIEFFPEEGKYYLDGHRACGCAMTPEETKRNGGRCPVCGKKVAAGALSRASGFSDRDAAPDGRKPFESLIPLMELLAETLGVSSGSKRVQRNYFELLERLGPELTILRDADLDMIRKAGGETLKEAVKRVRTGRVIRHCGYDGRYGMIRVFSAGEISGSSLGE